MKKYTIPQIIKIAGQFPICDFEQADEIAWYFHNQRITYVPSGNLHMGFYRMITAIWTAGYISGVQAERERRKGNVHG